MKFNTLLKLFFTILIVLHSNYTCTSKYKKKYENFISIAGKEVPGLPLIPSFKLSSEIPELINSAPADKKEWDQFAKRMEKLTQTFANEYQKFEADPRVINYRKIRDLVSEKQGLLEKKVKKIIETDPKVQNILTKINALYKKRRLAAKKWRTFSKTKVKPLEKKQEKLITKTSEQKYGDYEAIWQMTPAQTEAIEAEVKKTEKYKKLDTKLKPLKKYQKILYKKMDAIEKKISPLYKNLQNIKNEIKQSKNFPKSLKKLAKEINQLKIQEEKLHKNYRKFELEDANRPDPITDEIVSLRNKLFNLFKKMI